MFNTEHIDRRKVLEKSIVAMRSDLDRLNTILTEMQAKLLSSAVDESWMELYNRYKTYMDDFEAVRKSIEEKITEVEKLDSEAVG